MAAVSLENWEERIRDPKVECMSSDEMAALQSKRLVDVVKEYMTMWIFTIKMKETGVEPGDIRSIEDINKLPFTTKEDLSQLSIRTSCNSAVGCGTCAGNFRYYRKTDDRTVFTERCGSMGRMCGKMSDDGRTYKR